MTKEIINISAVQVNYLQENINDSKYAKHALTYTIVSNIYTTTSTYFLWSCKYTHIIGVKTYSTFWLQILTGYLLIFRIYFSLSN